MSKLANCFAELGERRALISFITAGDPTVAHTVASMHALVKGGTNVIELGVPFSDPEAEGPAIQRSSERALANGVGLAQVLEMVAEFRQRDTATPIVLMGYLNSVLAMPDFAAKAAAAGVDGLIMVNLPPEESMQLRHDLQAHGIDLIFLVAPTTTEQRCASILKLATGFVYYVSLKGITGASNLDATLIGERMVQLRAQQADNPLPICVGFGIKDAATATAVGQHSAGVVVGSALVNLMSEHADNVDDCVTALENACQALRSGLDTLA